MFNKDNTISISKNANSTRAQVIDGFVKGPAQPAARKQPASPPPQKSGTDRINKTPAHQLHKRTDKTHTLMRGSLKKPVAHLTSKIQKVTPGLSPQRAARAKSTAKHSQVKRFGYPGEGTNSGPQVVQGEVVPRNIHHHAAPVPKASSSAIALPSMVTSASHQKLERLLDEALTKANSHKQALRYQAARHFWQKPGFLGRRAGLKIGVCAVILLLLIGFVAWQKLPQFSVKVASNQANVDATVPSYSPEGYGFAGPASAQNSAVVIKYKNSGQASQSYDISQKESNMTSNSLAHTIIPPGSQVQTSQVGGNTIYVYGAKNDAAWVNNGVLHTISNNANLSTDEILKIVQGLN
ncbi:DUF4367 domain-containing protein [Candidatus Saccharibacteria bacterium]|nr:DUF4367 domain-containing protein [Candidatus Saccharibacteria bacterium]